MTQSMLIFVYRKAGTTPEEFQAYYESRHIALIKELAGAHFPLSHTRRYIQRTEGVVGTGTGTTELNAQYPATVLLGNQAEFDYDCCTELVFADADASQAFLATMSEPENAKRREADEDNFLDRSR